MARSAAGLGKWRCGGLIFSVVNTALILIEQGKVPERALRPTKFKTHSLPFLVSTRGQELCGISAHSQGHGQGQVPFRLGCDSQGIASWSTDVLCEQTPLLILKSRTGLTQAPLNFLLGEAGV